MAKASEVIVIAKSQEVIKMKIGLVAPYPTLTLLGIRLQRYYPIKAEEAVIGALREAENTIEAVRRFNSRQIAQYLSVALLLLFLTIWHNFCYINQKSRLLLF